MALWLSSFPRSGNTLVRQMLYAGWGQLSGSIYLHDLGDNLDLIRACGHVDLRVVDGPNGPCLFNPNNLIIKTHNLPDGGEQAIYVLREGRAACVSLWHFWNKTVSLPDIVRGHSGAGSWSRHVLGWLDHQGLVAVLRYEDLLARPEGLIAALSTVFGPPPADPAEPLRKRATLAKRENLWVKAQSDWRVHWSDELEDLFRQHNQPALDRMVAEYGAEYGDAPSLQPNAFHPAPAARSRVA